MLGGLRGFEHCKCGLLASGVLTSVRWWPLKQREVGGKRNQGERQKGACSTQHGLASGCSSGLLGAPALSGGTVGSLSPETLFQMMGTGAFSSLPVPQGQWCTWGPGPGPKRPEMY